MVDELEDRSDGTASVNAGQPVTRVTSSISVPLLGRLLVLLLAATIIGVVLGTAVIGLVASAWWATLAIVIRRRIRRAPTPAGDSERVTAVRTASRNLRRAATLLLGVCLLVFCSALLIQLGLVESTEFRIFTTLVVEALVVVVFLTTDRLRSWADSSETDISLGRVTGWLTRSAATNVHELGLPSKVPYAAAVTIVMLVAVCSLAAPMLGAAPIARGTGTEGIRELGQGKIPGSRPKNEGPEAPAPQAKGDDRPSPTGSTNPGGHTGGAATTPSPPEPANGRDPCGPVDSLRDYFLNVAIPPDRDAGNDLFSAWYQIGRPILGCPDVRQPASHVGTFWVVHLYHGSDGPAMLLVPDIRAPGRSGVVVFAQARDWVLGHLPAIDYLWPRVSFGEGDIQPVLLKSGECSALVRTFAQPAPLELPPPVFEVAIRLAAGRAAIPFLREVTERAPGDKRYVLGFAQPGEGGPAPALVTTPSEDVVVNSDGLVASGNGVTSLGRCGLTDVNALIAVANALENTS